MDRLISTAFSSDGSKLFAFFVTGSGDLKVGYTADLASMAPSFTWTTSSAPATLQGCPAACLDANGAIHIFCRTDDPDQYLLHTSIASRGTAPGAWDNLGGVRLGCDPGAMLDPVSQKVDVWTIGGDNTLYSQRQTTSGFGAVWTAAVGLVEPLTAPAPVPGLGTPLTKKADGSYSFTRQELVIARQATPYQSIGFYAPTSGSFWGFVGWVSPSLVGQIATATNPNLVSPGNQNMPYVFACDGTDLQFTAELAAPSTGWLAWQPWCKLLGSSSSLNDVAAAFTATALNGGAGSIAVAGTTSVNTISVGYGLAPAGGADATLTWTSFTTDKAFRSAPTVIWSGWYAYVLALDKTGDAVVVNVVNTTGDIIWSGSDSYRVEAAFDGVQVKDSQKSAVIYDGESPDASGTLGMHWPSARKMSSVVAYTPSNKGFWLSGHTGTVALDGSNDGSTWTTLASQIASGATVGLVITLVPPANQAAYTYHRVSVGPPTGLDRTFWAQLVFNSAPA